VNFQFSIRRIHYDPLAETICKITIYSVASQAPQDNSSTRMSIDSLRFLPSGMKIQLSVCRKSSSAINPNEALSDHSKQVRLQSYSALQQSTRRLEACQRLRQFFLCCQCIQFQILTRPANLRYSKTLIIVEQPARTDTLHDMAKTTCIPGLILHEVKSSWLP